MEWEDIEKYERDGIRKCESGREDMETVRKMEGGVQNIEKCESGREDIETWKEMRREGRTLKSVRVEGTTLRHREIRDGSAGH